MAFGNSSMSNLKSIPLPRSPQGTMQWDAFATWMHAYTREILARLDPRNPTNDYAAGLLANQDGSVTLGEAFPEGRIATVGELTTRISDEGRATDQRFLPMVSAGNRLSVQDAPPLTSAGFETTATIDIAAHEVQYGFGTVAYDGGTIAGLDNNEVYYLYADDPAFEGGAVSYVATTEPQDVVSQNGRYYVGSISTAIAGTTGNVADASSTDPVVITMAADHGWSNGDEVDFADMPGDFAALNAGTHIITVTALDAFSVPVDGSLFAAYSSGGTVTRISPDTGGGGGGGWDPRTVIP